VVYQLEDMHYEVKEEIGVAWLHCWNGVADDGHGGECVGSAATVRSK
jgi:hypothetical protein